MSYLDREFKNNTDIFEESTRTLLVDGDLEIYRKCCVHNEDDDVDRRLITSYLSTRMAEACTAAKCGKYRVFLTTKENFRHWISDRYKINRKGVVKPVNLAYVKQWAVDHMNAEYITYLEADDLMSIHQTDNTVIFSGDKDLRQVYGWHLNTNTMQLEFVDSLGSVTQEGKKILFNGYKGLMFQCLTGDTTDSILGCGTRVDRKYKSGANKGQFYIQRVGIGPKEALKILNNCPQTHNGYLETVKLGYKKLYGEHAMSMLEKECNLLFMVQEYDDVTKLAKRWTYDGRDEFINITTGEVI